MGACTSSPGQVQAAGGGRPARRGLGRKKRGGGKPFESVDRLNVLPNKHRAALLMGLTDVAGAGCAAKRSFRDSPLFDAGVLRTVFEMAAPSYAWKVEDVNKRVNRYGWTELMVAAKEGRNEEARALVNAGADLDLRTSGGSTALMNGCYYGHAGVVALLIRAGAKMDLKCNNGFTALRWAQDQGHEECARLLLDAGASAVPGA